MRYSILTILFSFTTLCSFGQTTTLGSITHDALQRDYRLYVPAVYDGSQEVPLVINLHGYTSNAFEQEIYGDFRPVADTANFILIHPEGTLDNSGTTFWNAFGSPNETVDDVGFISTLIDSIASEYNIDMNRIYSTGMSNGGFMSYKLACDLSYRIAAIASVTGAMIDPSLLPCNAVHPTPVMQIHGTADPAVPYLGSAGVLGAQAGVNYWVNYNNCNATAIETIVPDIDQTDGCTADHFLYQGGDQGSTVEFYRVNTGGHTWPGSNPFLAFGVTNMDFSASGEIWRFFSQFELDVLSTDINDPKLEAQVSIYPNPSVGNFVVEFDRIDERTLEVYDAVGQLVFANQIQGSITEIELSESGIYILTVTCKEGAFSKKLVRE